MKLGYTEREVKYMYFGKWNDLFKTYQDANDFRVKKGTFKEEKLTKLSEL